MLMCQCGNLEMTEKIKVCVIIHLSFYIYN